jgi:hypothetical protein
MPIGVFLILVFYLSNTFKNNTLRRETLWGYYYVGKLLFRTDLSQFFSNRERLYSALKAVY